MMTATSMERIFSLGNEANRSTDLALWQSQFGTAGTLSAATSAAVPEPSSALLLLLGLVAGQASFRRRRA